MSLALTAPASARPHSGLLGVAGSTALTLCLVAARVHHTGRGTFLFLGWNLFLAWLPVGCSAGALELERRGAPGWAQGLAFGLWLLLFPNAPYLVTDLVHLRPTPEVPLWFDAALLFCAAWTGLVLGLLSLQAMQDRVARAAGAAGGRAFAGAALALAALGMELGRFQRWNSWDLLARPGSIAADALLPFASPASHLGTLGFTAVFAAFLLCAHLAFDRARPQAQ